EDAIAEIGFRNRTKPRDRARARKVPCLFLVHVGRMDEAPFFIDASTVKQPPHRTSSRPGGTILDFLDLFGRVNVNGSLARQRDQLGKFAWSNGAKAVWRNADPLSVLRLDQPATLVEKASV